MKPKQSKSSASDSSMEQDNTDGGAEGDSLDDHDTSFDDPQPSTSKDFSPRSSIQSNQVDSLVTVLNIFFESSMSLVCIWHTVYL